MKKKTSKKSVCEEIKDKAEEVVVGLKKKIRNSPVGKKFRAADVHFKKDVRTK